MRQLNAAKTLRDSAEELQIWLDYMEIGKMLELKKQAKIYASNPENDSIRALVLKEIEVLQEHTE